MSSRKMKRHQLLLDEENFLWFQDWLRENRLPRSTTALLVNQFLLSLRKTITELEKKKSEGSGVSLGDLFAVTGLNAELEKISKE